ncbi:uncharacterized protein LOC141856834 isoform X2 [Brevipalpus obovatus]|uniref:uncharacterized protein LOC141856834 isoform X2 n=1 Tax=Brevipalpus obovatus TaxID=246614 RepID=UPI003D9E1DD1
MALIVYRGHKGMKKVTSERTEAHRVPQHRIVKDEHINENTKLTYVDFVPSFCKKVKDRVVYHSFRSLVCLANHWLLDHPGWEIISAETHAQYIPRTVDGVDYSADVYTLRMWIRRANIQYGEYSEMVFWFKDFTPQRREDDGTFESLEDIIQDINENIANGRINGKILQIETIKVAATDNWDYRSDATYISDGKTSRDIHRLCNVVLGVRLFFQIGECLEDEIVLADFVPEFELDTDEGDGGEGKRRLSESSDLMMASFGSPTKRKHKSERFSSLIKRVSEWLNRNPELNFCNAQATDIRVRGNEKPESIETRITWWVKQSTDKMIRFLRIFCTKPSEMFRMAVSTIGHASLFAHNSHLTLTAVAFDNKTFHEDVQEWYNEIIKDDPGQIVRKIATIETIIVPPFILDETGASFQHAVDQTLLGSPMEGLLKYSFLSIRVYYQERSGIEKQVLKRTNS